MKRYLILCLMSSSACGDGSYRFYMGTQNNSLQEIEVARMAFDNFHRVIGCDVAPLEFRDAYILVDPRDTYHQIEFLKEPDCESGCEGVTFFNAYSDIQMRQHPEYMMKDRKDYEKMVINVIGHELGHVFGLDHVDNPKDIMYPYENHHVINEDSWTRLRIAIMEKNPGLCSVVK